MTRPPVGTAVRTVTSNGQVTFQMTHDTSQSQPLPVIWFEVWYNAGQEFSFQLVTPSSEALDIPANTGDGGAGGSSGHGDSIGAYTTTSHPSNGQGYLWVQLLNQQAGVEAGVWQLSVVSQNGSSGAVDLYCERNQFNFTIDPAQRSNTAIVGMPGSASGVITVGSYNTRIQWDSIGRQRCQ